MDSVKNDTTNRLPLKDKGRKEDINNLNKTFLLDREEEVNKLMIIVISVYIIEYPILDYDTKNKTSLKRSKPVIREKVQQRTKKKKKKNCSVTEKETHVGIKDYKVRVEYVVKGVRTLVNEEIPRDQIK